MGTVTYQEYTAEELQAEIEELTRALGMPKEQAEQLAAADRLDPDRYQTLRKLADLLWLQSA